MCAACVGIPDGRSGTCTDPVLGHAYVPLGVCYSQDRGHSIESADVLGDAWSQSDGRNGIQRGWGLGAQQRDDPTVGSDLGRVDGDSEEHSTQE